MWGESIQLANIILGRKSRFKKKKTNKIKQKKRGGGKKKSQEVIQSFLLFAETIDSGCSQSYK